MLKTGKGTREAVDRLVARFPTSSFEDLCIHLGRGKNGPILDIRVHVSLEGLPEKVPTGKGFSLGINSLHELQKALRDTEKILEEQGSAS